jgi:hypothetical protein
MPGETQLMFYASGDNNQAMNIRLNDNTCFVLRRYMVCCFYDIPSPETARIMRISVSLLKRIRSWAKLDLWPSCQVGPLAELPDPQLGAYPVFEGVGGESAERDHFNAETEQAAC